MYVFFDLVSFSALNSSWVSRFFPLLDFEVLEIVFCFLGFGVMVVFSSKRGFSLLI